MPCLLLRSCRNKLVQITYALANVYDDSPDLEVRVTDEHRARAEEMMACVESGDVTRLREAFLEVRANRNSNNSSSSRQQSAHAASYVSCCCTSRQRQQQHGEAKVRGKQLLCCAKQATSAAAVPASSGSVSKVLGRSSCCAA
jgi:hypothetical protein